MSEPEMKMAPNQAEAMRILEVEEYLMAVTESKTNRTPEQRAIAIRELLMSHRFFVYNALMLGGAQLPARMLTDAANMAPGRQCVDEPRKE